MEAVLALVVMTSINHEPWRWLLGLSSLPILLVLPLFLVSNRVCIYLISEVIQIEISHVLIIYELAVVLKHFNLAIE